MSKVVDLDDIRRSKRRETAAVEVRSIVWRDKAGEVVETLECKSEAEARATLLRLLEIMREYLQT